MHTMIDISTHFRKLLSQSDLVGSGQYSKLFLSYIVIMALGDVIRIDSLMLYDSMYKTLPLLVRFVRFYVSLLTFRARPT